MNTPREKSRTEQIREQQSPEDLPPEELDSLIQQKAAEFLQRMLDGVCTVCGGVVTKEVQVVRCVYAEPCGHRIRNGHVRQQQ